MLVTLIMINGASLGWDGAGHQARAKGLNIALSSRHSYRGNKKPGSLFSASNRTFVEL